MYTDPYLNSYFSTRVKRRRRKRLIRFFLLLFLAASMLAVFVQFIKYGAKTITEISGNVLSVRSENPSLKSVVENALAETEGTYGIAIKNLKSGESYYLNQDQSFEAGSLYKLWTLAAVFKQIQDGILKEDENLSADIALLNKKYNIASAEAELREGTVNFTIKSALTQMITISHNYAALALTEKVKLPSVAQFLKEAGLDRSEVGTENDPPKTTPSDIALFYEKLYKRQLVDEVYTTEMLELLKKQQLNDGLPKLLPAETKVAHKTGDIGFFKHDGGIVFSDKGDYIIVVLSESNSPAGAQERIAQISKAVFDYFNSLDL